MFTSHFELDGDIGGMGFRSEEPTVDAGVLVSKLAAFNPSFHSDMGSRHDLLHPDIDIAQGLFYMGLHVSRMDRGVCPMWPVFKTQNDLVEVPLDYALAHDDLPVTDFNINDLAFIPENPTAHVMMPRADMELKVGWAEVFWRLHHNKHVPITAGDLGAIFNLPMDWIGSLTKAPAAYVRDEANKYVNDFVKTYM